MSGRIEQVLESEQRRAKKVETLLALLRDPELSDVVGRLIDETPRPQAVAAKNGHLALVPGEISAALRAVGPKLLRGFTIHDAVRVLAEQGYAFTRKPTDQVRDSLYFLVREDQPIFRVLEAGRAGKLSTYEYAG
jgi:hypothetical protein